jgi:AcrR family transcriptional regulator
MKAKSDLLAASRRSAASPTKRRKPRPPRLPREERRAQILDQASKFFAEYGLTAQTRALADSCGVSQRLLYSFFPSKAALLEEVYRSEIAGPFKAIWFADLKDRTQSVEQRLIRFYSEYYDTVTTRRWLRLFLYASLAEMAMAPTYIAAIVTHMLEIIVAEAALEQKLKVPDDPALVQEVGWVLHGAVSHLAIRRHVYANTNPLPAHEVVALHVRSFLGGLGAILPPLPKVRGQVYRQLTTKSL